MLEFFRKYQKYFFLVITVVIVISFSFFGTYNTLSSGPSRDRIVFTAIDGSSIYQSELNELAFFIGTDGEDKKLMGGIWGPNFLNDGVIKKDFLQTGLAHLLVEAYAEEIERDLQSRLEKEKRYTPYVHPQAPFLSTSAAWSYFVPEMRAHFDALRTAEKGSDPEAFEMRVSLFLDEKKLPPTLLKQVLRYQQRQYKWLHPDPNLEHLDLSLFGYHTLEDWFGPRFVRLVSEFIINASKIAEAKGYKVTREEALADLAHNAEISFQQNLKNPYLGVTNQAEYFNEQLRRLGMDQNRAIKLWTQVLLFRRLFQDVGNAVFVDPLLHQQFQGYANETAIGELYRLPSSLQFNDFRQLQKFEVYLDAVTKRGKSLLDIPSTILSTAEVSKESPELVQKRYTLQVAQVRKEMLAARIGLKETWKWEADDANWSTLADEFSELNLGKAKTHEERVSSLDALDDTTRSRVDAFARNKIVEEHPEWIEQALQNADPQEMQVGIRTTGGQIFVAGLEDRKELLQWLDQAPLSHASPATPSEEEAARKLAFFTGDNRTFYRITVIERDPEQQVMTFAEADKEGVLDQLLDRDLEAHYQTVRDYNADLFRKDDMGWKPFSEVKNQVASLYFVKILKAINDDYTATHEESNTPLTNDRSASLRFYQYGRKVLEQLKKNPNNASQWITDEKTSQTAAEQWKWVKSQHEATRSKESPDLRHQELFQLNNGEWTSVSAPANGNLSFFMLTAKESKVDPKAVLESIESEQKALSYDAQQNYMKKVLEELKQKDALSLDYLDTIAQED